MRYDAWEKGCESDPVRNGFLVPNIVQFLNENPPDSILDIGSLTGYMVRKIGTQIRCSPTWTLLDSDADAIEYSKVRMPSQISAQFANSSIENWSVDEKFDVALVTFTLLEFVDQKDALVRMVSLLSDGGYLVIALPDCLEDVVEASEKAGDIAMLHRFIDKDLPLEKTDKFTAQPYPFRATRISRVICDAMEAGFALVSIKRETPSSDGVFLLIFQRAHSHG